MHIQLFYDGVRACERENRFKAIDGTLLRAAASGAHVLAAPLHHA